MASNTAIQLKKSGITGNTPLDLYHGEVAINYADGKLYYKDDINGIRYITNQDTFGSILANGSLVISTTPTDILNLVPNNNIKIIGSPGSKTINFDLSNEISVSNLIASNVIAHTALYVGIADISHTPLANSLGYFTGNSSPYIQVNIENIDPNGSSDWVATADVGSDETFYTDVGIQNSGHADGTIKPLDGYLLVQGNTGQIGGNLVIGTISGTPGQEIRAVVGGNEDANVILKINETGLQIVKGDITSNITTRISDVSNSSFSQANLAYDTANAANILAQAAYNYANTIIGGGGSSSDYFPTDPYGFVSQSIIALVSNDMFIQGEYTGPVYDCSDNPITPEGFYLEKDLGYLT